MTNMNPIVELGILEIVKTDIREGMKRGADPRAPTTAIVGRKVDRE